MHKTSNNYIKDMSTSIIARGEENDCVVRAIAASFDMSYDEAHAVAKNVFGRKDKDGVYATINTFYKLEKNFERINRKSIKIIPTEEIRYPGSARYISEKNPRMENTQPIVVSQLIQKFPKGRYVVLIKKHAFSLIDGIIVGNIEDGNRMRAKVLNLVKVE